MSRRARVALAAFAASGGVLGLAYGLAVALWLWTRTRSDDWFQEVPVPTPMTTWPHAERPAPGRYEAGPDANGYGPHCDARILHAPGVCEFCDGYPQRQFDRAAQSINFTGGRDPDKAPCPADAARGSNHELWAGNLPPNDPRVAGTIYDPHLSEKLDGYADGLRLTDDRRAALDDPCTFGEPTWLDRVWLWFACRFGGI